VLVPVQTIQGKRPGAPFMIIAAAVSAGAHPKVSSEGTYWNLEPMNWSEEPRKLIHRSHKIWKQRKAELEELARRGQNWALEELQRLRQAARVKITEHMSNLKRGALPKD
jgi:hypothetical protein